MWLEIASKDDTAEARKSIYAIDKAVTEVTANSMHRGSLSPTAMRCDCFSDATAAAGSH